MVDDKATFGTPKSRGQPSDLLQELFRMVNSARTLMVCFLLGRYEAKLQHASCNSSDVPEKDNNDNTAIKWGEALNFTDSFCFASDTADGPCLYLRSQSQHAYLPRQGQFFQRSTRGQHVTHPKGKGVPPKPFGELGDPVTGCGTQMYVIVQMPDVITSPFVWSESGDQDPRNS